MVPKRSKSILMYVAIAAAVFLSLYFIIMLFNEEPAPPKYSDIMVKFDKLEVKEYNFDLGTGELEIYSNDYDKNDANNYKLHGKVYYTLKDSNAEDNESNREWKKITYNVPNVSLFLNDIEGYRVRYNENVDNQLGNPDDYVVIDYKKVDNKKSWIASFLPSFILIAVMIGFFMFMMRQAGGGGKMSQFGKANVKTQPQTGSKKTFDDVAGAKEEKEELSEIVDFLKNPKKYNELGARIPKGVLLLGPPGTGKTLLAKAVAGEAKAPFFSISGSDFVEMFVGVGASRVRDLFEQAKKNSPSIIFIDEIDAVGRHRGAGLGGGHDEREQTLNQLLVEMDGFTGNEGIIVIAATNRRDILDPALLRPGRFDRQIFVGYPDIKGREEILVVHTKGKPLAPDVDLKVIARTSAGFTGADLENLVNEAALLAAKNNRKAITNSDMEEATIKVVAGPEKKSKVVSDKEKKLTAYHEAGHAITTYFCETQDKVHQISIIPRGMAGGFTMSLPEHDISYRSKREMQEQIVVLLGGRVAEKLMLDDISTGASNDIERATSIARNMVTRYGFSDKLGPIVYGQDSNEVFLGKDFSQNRNYSENVAAEIDAEIREIVEEAYETAKEILDKNRETLIVVAEYLLTHEKIDGVDFEKLMKGELDEITDDEFKKEAKVHEDELSSENPQDIDLDEGKKEDADDKKD